MSSKTLNEFFAEQNNWDVKIKILKSLHWPLVRYLCLISKGCLEICRSSKFWRQKIIYHHSRNVLPVSDLKIEDWIKLYFSLSRCHDSLLQNRKYVPCIWQTASITHDCDYNPDANKYCYYHLNSQCTYIFTKGRAIGIQCDHLVKKLTHSHMDEPGNDMFCRICINRSKIRKMLYKDINPYNSIKFI